MSRRHAPREWTARLAVLAAALVVTFAARLHFLSHDRTMAGDGQQGIRIWEVARTAWDREHAFALWDRSQCGGYPFLGNPETPLASSFVAGLLGIHGDVMQRWYPALFTLVGMLGAYAWSRKVLSLRTVPAVFAGALFVASNAVATQFSAHMWLVPFALVPWVLLLARLGEDDLRAAAGAGAVLAFMAIEGGTYPVAYAIVALAICEGPRLLVSDGGLVRVLRMALVCGGIFVLVAGVKAYPTLVQLVRFPGHAADRDASTWQEALQMLLDRDRLGATPGHAYGWDEYRGYVGPVAFGMAIAGTGAALVLKPRRWEVAAILVLALLLVRGRTSDVAPFALFARLPLHDHLRVPSRFLLLASLAVGAASGVALQVAFDQLRNKAHAAVVLVVALVGVADPIAAGQRLHLALGSEPFVARPDPPAPSFRIAAGTEARVAEYPMRGLSAVACQKEWAYHEATGHPFDKGKLSWTKDGEVHASKVTQNGHAIDVTMRVPGTLHVIQTFDADWQASVGTPRMGPTGLTEIVLPPGRHHVVLRYAPKGLLAGIVATILGTILLALVLVVGPRLQKRRVKA